MVGNQNETKQNFTVAIGVPIPTQKSSLQPSGLDTRWGKKKNSNQARGQYALAILNPIPPRPHNKPGCISRLWNRNPRRKRHHAETPPPGPEKIRQNPGRNLVEQYSLRRNTASSPPKNRKRRKFREENPPNELTARRERGFPRSHLLRCPVAADGSQTRLRVARYLDPRLLLLRPASTQCEPRARAA